MRIEDDQRRRIGNVVLGLTEAEATELLGALEQLLAAPTAGHHHHVSSADYRTEVTVWLVPEDD